ncbi:MAG: carbonic anhydrase [Marinilabiliales bacterium]|nr:MAG: carbonic anhydrase [Marinilabiliales bacterium]
METLTKEIQDKITPQKALEILIEGNKRFVNKTTIDRDLNSQVEQTSGGQYPMAAVLGCIDSRVPSEHVFDLGIGDIFNARVAGNIINEDILGSLEYSCKVAGSKLILVLGHTACGAVTAACNNVELGNITALLSKIKPAVNEFSLEIKNGTHNVDEVAAKNVQISIDNIRRESSILAEMEKNNEILIKGAMYDVGTGKVTLI